MSATPGTDTPDAPRSRVRWWRVTAEGVVIVAGVPTLLRAALYDGGGGEVWRTHSVIVVLAVLALWVSWRLRAPTPDGPSGLIRWTDALRTAGLDPDAIKLPRHKQGQP